MNIVHLMHQAQAQLEQSDIDFNEQVEVVLTILRSQRCLPFMRAKLNGHVHRQVAAALVLAHRAGQSVDVSTRHLGHYHWNGISTCLINYLDKLLKTGMLLGSANRAKGKLTLGPVLQAYLN